MAAGAAMPITSHQLQLLCCAVSALLWAALPTALASAAAMLQAGDAAYGNGDYSTAIRHYTSAIDLDPSTPLFYTKRAAAHISLKKYAQALKDLDRAVDVDETFTQGYLHRGKLHRWGKLGKGEIDACAQTVNMLSCWLPALCLQRAQQRPTAVTLQ